MGEKWEVLTQEVDLIKDESIKQFTKDTLNNTPDYFFSAAASSTGKYHPTCTIKVGGLIVHVKRAVYLASRLCDGLGLKGKDKDIVLSAVILHDIAKTGQGAGSYDDYVNHPLNAEKYFVLSKNDLETSTIKECIKHHMGLWSPDKTKKSIDKYSIAELITYISDYLSSTKDLITPKDI